MSVLTTCPKAGKTVASKQKEKPRPQKGRGLSGIDWSGANYSANDTRMPKPTELLSLKLATARPPTSGRASPIQL